MKKRMLWTAATLLLACLLAVAGAEATREDAIGRYAGAWTGDGYRLHILIEDERVFCRLTEIDGDHVWEFDPCWYDEEDARLYCPNYVRYRQVLDWDSMELLQEDWALGDLGFTFFAFAGNENTLIGSDIPGLENSLTLRRELEGDWE